MLAKIADNDWIYLDQITQGIEPAIIEHFSVKHPRSYFMDTMQQSWDGWYRKYDTTRQRLARPFLHDLESVCKTKDIPLEIQDLREPVIVPDANLVTPDYLPGITLDQYQIDGIKASTVEEVGIYAYPTGAGKTEVMAGITKLHDCFTVIIAEQRVVIEQIRERLKLRDIFDVGLFYGGSTPSGQKVVVGSIQSLATPPESLRYKRPQMYAARMKHARQFQAIVKKAQILLVDECDRASSANYRYLFKNWFKGRRKFGFSGTPFDTEKPVENLILREYLGSVIATADRRELEALGRIVPIKFFMFAMGENGNKQDKTTFDQAEREQMIDNPNFHEKVAKVVRAFPNDGTLILVDTCNVEDLGFALEKAIPNSIFIYGKTAQSKRRKYLKLFEQREIKCLIGGKILKRGLDLKGGVENLVICGGGKLWSDYDQKIGRALRRNSKGYSRVFSFLHLNNFYLYKHGRSQLKAVVDLGYETKVIFRDLTVDGAELVRRKFRKPKPE